MSRSETGAASAAPLAAVDRDTATPAKADQWEAEAIEAIENVQDPAEAERLLGKVSVAAEAMRVQKLGADRERRWRALRLKAERRYGELLPPKQPGKRTDKEPVSGANRSTGAQRVAQHEARKVAEVPADEFTDYVDNDPKPSRDGLLRSRKPEAPKADQQREYGNKHWENDEVIAWAARRMKVGRTRDELVTESQAGAYDWPLPGRWLGKNAADIVRAIVLDRKRRGDSGRRRQPSESGTRLRQLHADKRAGRRAGDLWHLQVAIAEAAGRVEAFYLPDLDWSDETDQLILDIRDDLLRHASWNEAAFDVVVAHMSELARQRTYNLLVERANDPSSTQNERTVAARKAENLRRRIAAARLGS